MPLEVPGLIADSMQMLREVFGISHAVLAREMLVQTALLDELLSARFDHGAFSAKPDNVVPMFVGHDTRNGASRYR